MDMKYYLGLDIGTSGTKALVMDVAGTVIATAMKDHPIYSPKPGWSEQAPADWWTSSAAATRAVMRKAGVKKTDIAGIGLSGQMHGLVLLDAAGNVLRNALIWNDQRTAPQAAEIEKTVGGRSKLIKLVGNAAMTSFTLTKLLWVRQHEPKIFERAATMLLPKDYIRFCMTGERIGEVSDMSGTLMLDQKRRTWSKPIISAFEIDASILPPVVESHEITGHLTAAAAKTLGLVAGIPVVGGGGDQPAAAIGNGIVRNGMVSAMMGTSGVVFTHSKEYRVDPKSAVNTFCSCVDGEWCMFGCILSAGGSLQWLRNTLDGDYKQMDKLAAAAEPGCEGLFFLPYLTGERTPHVDPLARGSFIGLTARTRQNELIRSVMEGATFAMTDVMRLIEARGVNIGQVRLSGGGARGAFWRQLQADIYGKTCVTINSEEGGALGVALLAAVADGEYRDIRQATKAAIEVTRTIKPAAAAKRRYAKLHEQYDRFYPALKKEFARLAQL